jgi:integrase
LSAAAIAFGMAGNRERAERFAGCIGRCDSYVFVNAKNSGPVEQREWPKDHWRRALTATKVRPRKFYATKHTFISVALTKGLNLKFIAEYCGTSVAMIEQDYGLSGDA